MNPELERLLLLKGRETLPCVLVTAAECSPLSKTGGLADVVGALPKALNSLGFDARVITPYHRCIKDKYAAEVKHLCHFFVDFGWDRQYAGLELLELPGLTVYLIDSEYYFGDKIYRGGEAEVEQYAFFQRAVLDAIPLLPDYAPNVLHCNDWHTAMLPFLIKTQYQVRPQGALKTVLTIHNMAFQGWLSFERANALFGIDPRWYSIDGIRHGDCANFMKAGCLFADRVNTVSPTYADEIRTPAFGETLQDLLLYRGCDVSGILNGLDTEVFNPADDSALVCNFDRSCPEKKRENKLALLKELNLTKVDADTPLIAMVTRMTAQKGFDLVLQALDTIMEQGAAVVLLGTGDAAYEDAMRAMEQRYKGRLCAYLAYSEPLSRRIYAGADFLLMPSAFEPCGLSQLIAMRYGTLPIVHEVGGLRDTVRPYNRFTGEGNGFSFYDFNVGTLLGTVAYALATYQNRPAMAKLIDSAMGGDYSFGPAAVEYGRLYLSVLPAERALVEHDSTLELYRSPLGAVKCGETVRLRLKATEISGYAELLADDEVIPMHKDADGFFSVDFRAPEQPGLVHYAFRLAQDVNYGTDGIGGSDMHPWTITVYDANFETPAWAEGAVMYQVFPDRFAPGGSSFEKGVKYHRGKKRSIEVHGSWNEPVKYRPGSDDGEHYRPNDFYGGTLRGITDRLPELHALGVRCLYLNPIFESDSNHRYNIADYRKIDPMLGTQADFRALCAAAQKLGMHIVLDGVFSHTGDDSIYFNKYGHYPGPGAYQSKESPYYPWYDFRDFPDEYRCWWGFRSLPEVDETNPDWQKFIITGDDSVIRHWLRQGTCGWRLDVADELPDEVIALMRDAVKAQKPDALLLGEVWEDATTKISYGVRRTYALGKGLDSVMNYPLRTALIDFALGRLNAPALQRFLLDQKLSYPAPMYRCLMNLLSSHDTARIRTVLGCGEDGSGLSREQQALHTLTPAQNARGRALQKLCAALQFALPGIPCIYYGDEEGMQGFRDPFCRAPYRRRPDSLRSYYARLAAARNASEALRHGNAAFAAYGDDVVCILRWTDTEARIVAVNRGSESAAVSPSIADFAALPAADASRFRALPKLKIAPGGVSSLNVKLKV